MTWHDVDAVSAARLYLRDEARQVRGDAVDEHGVAERDADAHVPAQVEVHRPALEQACQHSTRKPVVRSAQRSQLGTSASVQGSGCVGLTRLETQIGRESR